MNNDSDFGCRIVDIGSVSAAIKNPQSDIIQQ